MGAGPKITTVGWLALCLPLTKESEGLRLRAYADPATGGKPWTIGYGATTGVKPGDVWTKEQADMRLNKYMQTVGRKVDALVTVLIGPPQKATLCDFVYNVGVSAFATSTLLRMLNSGDYAGAAEQFPRWKYAKGKIMPGLVTRRRRERSLFLHGTWN